MDLSPYAFGATSERIPPDGIMAITWWSIRPGATGRRPAFQFRYHPRRPRNPEGEQSLSGPSDPYSRRIEAYGPHLVT
ncbi:MAG: hypothetical protein HPM95_17190 [Alphaproteobacteria bacterium]|nr:hypothetical protein [Alphaproteobacteria bacterium]